MPPPRPETPAIGACPPQQCHKPCGLLPQFQQRRGRMHSPRCGVAPPPTIPAMWDGYVPADVRRLWSLSCIPLCCAHPPNHKAHAGAPQSSHNHPQSGVETPQKSRIIRSPCGNLPPWIVLKRRNNVLHVGGTRVCGHDGLPQPLVGNPHHTHVIHPSNVNEYLLQHLRVDF